MHRNRKDQESAAGNVSISSFLVAVSQNVLILHSIFSFSEMKKADSAKTQSLEVLKDENNKVTQELDISHQGQSELIKVKRARE